MITILFTIILFIIIISIFLVVLTQNNNLSIYIKQNRLNNETENLKNMILKDILYISKL